MNKSFISLVLIWAFIGNFAFADIGKSRPGLNKPWKELKLSTEQKTVLADALEESFEDIESYNEELKVSLTSLNDAILNGNENEIRTIASEVAAVRVELQVIKAAVLQELISALTDEQYQILLDIVAAKNERVINRRDALISFVAGLIDRHSSEEESGE